MQSLLRNDITAILTTYIKLCDDIINLLGKRNQIAINDATCCNRSLEILAIDIIVNQSVNQPVNELRLSDFDDIYQIL